MRGRGLLVALDLKQDIAPKVVELARDDGLLLNAPRPNLLRFMPALNLSQEEIDTMLAMLENAWSVWCVPQSAGPILAGVSSGNFCRNATRPQILASSWVLPQAGIPDILMPCLITQNISGGVADVLCQIGRLRIEADESGIFFAR